MIPDTSDTIVAISTAPGGAARGIVRLSGPATVQCLLDWNVVPDSSPDLSDFRQALEVSAALELGGNWGQVPCQIFLWPDSHSYTRQPTAELHTLGSAAILEAAVQQACLHGARLAMPGEFTLRAFLAGRLDLTQAEAVLGLVDARDSSMLATALNQLAGGLSGPLTTIREDLLQILAHLEAGLDFVEEDIEFISTKEILAALQSALQALEEVTTALNLRGETNEPHCAVLVGKPNAGKSSLFNALLERSELGPNQERALVSVIPGTTRDYLSSEMLVDGLHCLLIDTAGMEEGNSLDFLAAAAQRSTTQAQSQADCCLFCLSSEEFTSSSQIPEDSALFIQTESQIPCIRVLTKCDLHRPTEDLPGWNMCSSITGEGLTDLCRSLAAQLATSSQATGLVQPTLVRCRASLLNTEKSLQSAVELIHDSAGEELIAAEIRLALHEIGAVVGAVYTDDVLDKIFSQFCIGK